MVLLASLLFAALAGAKCFEPDIAHPPPEYNVHDPLLQEAFESINTALTAAVAAPIHARSSFSVEITSSEETLWSYHNTARERNASRPDPRSQRRRVVSYRQHNKDLHRPRHIVPARSR
jgi:hypothetical protein